MPQRDQLGGEGAAARPARDDQDARHDGEADSRRWPHEPNPRRVQSLVTQGVPPFQILLERHSDEVWRALRAMVGVQAAEDCFQETFLAALRAYPRLRPDSTPRAWLLAIAHNKAIDHLRRNARQQTAEVEAAGEDPPTPDEAIWRAVAELAPRQRAAVALRYIGDLSHREIAEAIGCSEEASRRSLHDGLETLRRQL
jgi:RNA polymerase sigma factor (sigma-70 family)